MKSVSRLFLLLFSCLLLGTANATNFPAHWGDPPSEQHDDHIQLPYGYGYGSSTLAQWIETNVKLNRFPEEWGNPPAEQSEDYVQLPGNYGYGSSTLYDWISSALGESEAIYEPETQIGQNQGGMGGTEGVGGGSSMAQGNNIGEIFSPMLTPLTTDSSNSNSNPITRSSTPEPTPTLPPVATPSPTPFVDETRGLENEGIQPAIAASTPTPNSGTTIINNIFNNNNQPTNPTSANNPNTNIISLTAQDQGQTVRTDPNGLIRITLDSNPSSGYTWDLAAPNNGALSVYSNETYTKDTTSNVTGDPFSTDITLQALKPGIHEVTLVYRRNGGEPEQIARSFTFRVNVSGNLVTIFDPNATPTPIPTPTPAPPSDNGGNGGTEIVDTPTPDDISNTQPNPTPRITPEPDPSPTVGPTPNPGLTLPPVSMPTPPPISEPGDDKRDNPYGFTPPSGVNMMVFVFWFNVDTGQSWWANTSGWVPPTNSWVLGVQNTIISYDPNPYDFGLPKEKFLYEAPEFWLNTSTFEGWWAPSRGFVPPNLQWIKQAEPLNYPSKNQLGFLRVDQPAAQIVTHYYNIYTGQVVTLPTNGYIPPNIEWRRGPGPGPLRSPRNPYGFAPPNLAQAQQYTYWHNRETNEGWWAQTLGWTPSNNNWTTNLYQPIIGDGNPFGFLPPRPGSNPPTAISSWINALTGQAWTFPESGYAPPDYNWFEGTKHPLSP